MSVSSASFLDIAEPSLELRKQRKGRRGLAEAGSGATAGLETRTAATVLVAIRAQLSQGRRIPALCNIARQQMGQTL